MTFLSEYLDGACIIIRTNQFCLDSIEYVIDSGVPRNFVWGVGVNKFSWGQKKGIWWQ